MKTETLFGASLVASALIAGCGRCALVSSAEVRPGNELTLRVGESATAEYWITGRCGNPPTSPTAVALRWATVDTLVVRVDSLSGIIRALLAGDAYVWGRYPDDPTTIRRADLLVHVP